MRPTTIPRGLKIKHDTSKLNEMKTTNTSEDSLQRKKPREVKGACLNGGKSSSPK